jgi:hypothetical protein
MADEHQAGKLTFFGTHAPLVEEKAFAVFLKPLRGNQLLQHQAPEQLGEHQHRQEEAGPSRNPALPIRRQTATRYNHVHVRMMRHGRAPGVQHRGDLWRRSQGRRGHDAACQRYRLQAHADPRRAGQGQEGPACDALAAAARAAARVVAAVPLASWLFPSRDPLLPITARQLNRVCHMAAEAAGLGTGVSPHTLRHSFATTPTRRIGRQDCPPTSRCEADSPPEIAGPDGGLFSMQSGEFESA